MSIIPGDETLVNPDALHWAFLERFGRAPEVRVRAPGRVNLIGEHVDYCGGPVMPVAIGPATVALAARRNDHLIRAWSRFADEAVEIARSDAAWPRGWAAYIGGIVAVLRERGVPVGGADLLIDGDLPPEAGLASSAALTASTGLALATLAGAVVDRVELARSCREAERRYVGVPCGIMDPWACLLSRAGQVLLLDCRRERAEYAAWPGDRARILVVDSRSPHRLTSSVYADRVRECADALRAIRSAVPGIQADCLAEVSPDDLSHCVATLPSTPAARARHVVSECARVRAAAEALRAGDLATLGGLLNESHESLAVDYAVSSARMDDLAAIVRAVPGVYGARMTGGGFGGCVAAVAKAGAAERVETALRSAYDEKYSVRATVRETLPGEGATVTALP